MRLFLSFFLVFISSIGYAQQSVPVSFNVKAILLSPGNYRVTIHGFIQPGWYVYATDDAINELQKPTLLFDNARIQLIGALKLTSQDVITSLPDPIFENKMLSVYKNTLVFSQDIRIPAPIPSEIEVNVGGYASNATDFVPIDESLIIAIPGGQRVANVLLKRSIDINNPVSACGDIQQDSSSLLVIFLLGVGGGLIALLTPCVFPMIPVTVSFFTNKAKNKTAAIKNGLWYGGFIFLIYGVASLPFHLLGNVNPQIFNSISTNAWVNVFFFIVFIVFALSFFGLFEIRMPASFTNVAGSKGDLGSIGGIFFMALTLATVSFSCTGPILGSLLVGSLSSSSGAWQLTLGMGGFGLALAAPFAMFAMFPQWMKALPKSGGWLETVKKTLAFVELALAVKFLSNADLVQHWGLLKREVFIALWILIALGLSLYLFGAFTKRRYIYAVHSTAVGRMPEISFGRRLLGLIVLLFAFYLLPGLTQSSLANLKLLSGFPPPLSYSIYGVDNIHGKGVEPDFINDYDQALAFSKQSGKPLLIDFTGWACVNCRKMEEHVWTDPEIKKFIKDHYILVSLYVDDRKKLPPSQRFTHQSPDGSTKDIKTVGNKWATFQAENFKQVTQPLYAVVDTEEKLLTNPVGYTPDVEEYLAWLQCGINTSTKLREVKE